MKFNIDKKLYALFGFTFIFLMTTVAQKEELSNQCPIKFRSSNRSIVALILARGGSKGIPLKNLAKVGDISLLGRALNAVHKCHQCFDEVWVSTDNELIAEEARRYNSNVHYRSSYAARDEATSIESIHEFLNGHAHIENIALIQCTSVFVHERYLNEAVKIFKNKPNIDCVFSVFRSFKLRWKQVSNSTQLIQPINFDPKNRPRRQDWAGELVETGMFYFARKQLIKNQGLLQNHRCEFVEIDENHVLEIDNPFQLKLANILVNISMS